MVINLTSDIPSKKNSKIIVCRGAYPLVLPSKAYKAWHEIQMWELKKYRPAKPIEKCSLIITIYSKTKRSADLDNKLGSILDILKDAEIIADDNWKNIPAITISFGGVNNIGGAIITINEIKTP